MQLNPARINKRTEDMTNHIDFTRKKMKQTGQLAVTMSTGDGQVKGKLWLLGDVVLGDKRYQYRILLDTSFSHYMMFVIVTKLKCYDMGCLPLSLS